MSGGRQGTERRARTELVGVRLTPGELARLSGAAERWHQSVASLLREAGLAATMTGGEFGPPVAADLETEPPVLRRIQGDPRMGETRGNCPVCNFRFRLRKDGAVQAHHLYHGSEKWPEPCKGSGQPSKWAERNRQARERAQPAPVLGQGEPE